ncbi:MAG: type II secretion system F family protein [Deltaproteobacteria bacterium]
MEYVLLILASVTVTALILGIIYTLKRQQITLNVRLEAINSETAPDILPPELQKPLKQRVKAMILPSLLKLAGKMPRNQQEIYEQRLKNAGNPHNMEAATFLLFKYAILGICALIGLSTGSPTGFVVLIFLGFLIPEIYLKGQEKARRETILRSLPDILDLISVSVEAGLGFDGALQKVCEKSQGPLSDEFERSLQELNLGKPRREALRDMADRVNVDDVSTFLASIIQADQLGVSITNVLRLQSRQVRNNRRMKAEEQAQKAPVKILLPLLLFIFPTILIVLLGPAVIQLMDAF